MANVCNLSMIEPERRYAREEIMRILGISEFAFRTMVKRGLKKARLANNYVILGRDLLDHIEGDQDAKKAGEKAVEGMEFIRSLPADHPAVVALKAAAEALKAKNGGRDGE